MAYFSKGCNKPSKSIGLYDVIVGAFIIATFVLENATYSLYFSIIQLTFLAYSLWRIFVARHLMLTKAITWTACVGVGAVVLSFANIQGINSQTFSVIKNCIKCLCISIYIVQTGSPRRLIQSIAIAGMICGMVLLVKFVNNPNDYNELRYATISRVGADIAGGNVNIVSMNMCFAFSAWLYLEKSSRSAKDKLLAYLCLCFVAVTTLLTGSRKILLFFAVSFLIAHYDVKAKYKVVGLVGVIALYIAMMEVDALYFIIGHKIDFLSETENYTMYAETNGDRINLLWTGLRFCWEYPFGIGFGGSNRLIGIYTHNNFVEVLLSMGLIGFIVYYASYFLITIRAWKERKTSAVYDYLLYTVVGLMVVELGQVTCLYTMPVVFLSMGLTYITSGIAREDK